MITKISVVKTEDVVVNHESRLVKSNPVLMDIRYGERSSHH